MFSVKDPKVVIDGTNHSFTTDRCVLGHDDCYHFLSAIFKPFITIQEIVKISFYFLTYLVANQ